MSTTPEDNPRRDEELLAWLLDEETRRRTSRAELEAGGDGVAERLDEWGAFLQGCRAELTDEADLEAQDVAGLSERVLARTTREDVTWRGDWRLVRGFLAQRMSASVVLRVVAASLLVHIAALPVLAYYTWVAPERGTVVRFDPTPDERELPFRDAEPEPSPIVEELALPALPSDDAAALPGAAELYRTRLGAVGAGDALTRALRVEALLDEAEGGDGDRESLAAAIADLGRDVRGSATSDDAPALRAILASAWLRAATSDAVRSDEILTASCRRWVGQPEPLRGARWHAAYLRATVEADGR